MVEKVFDFRGIEVILKEVEEVFIRIFFIYMNGGVIFEFDRESEKIKLKCSIREGNVVLFVFFLFVERRYSKF